MDPFSFPHKLLGKKNMLVKKNCGQLESHLGSPQSEVDFAIWHKMVAMWSWLLENVHMKSLLMNWAMWTLKFG